MPLRIPYTNTEISLKEGWGRAVRDSLYAPTGGFLTGVSYVAGSSSLTAFFGLATIALIGRNGLKASKIGKNQSAQEP